jgi:hypothetical protein
MLNQRGLMGCGNIIIIIWVTFMLSFLGLIILNRNLFYVPPEKEMVTSRVAARRCRQKLEMFNTNDYIRNLFLNELEINSALKEEFTQGEHGSFLSVFVEMQPGNLNIEGKFILAELVPKIIQSVFSMDTKKKEGEEDLRRVAVIKMTGRPVIEQKGQLFLNPHNLTIGKQNIPGFIVKIICKIKPQWFTYQISPKIKEVNVGSEKLELVKW